MARRKRKVKELEESTGVSQGEREVIEFDESLHDAESSQLAEVHSATEDPSVMMTDPVALQACEALEQQLGGLEAIAASASVSNQDSAVGLEHVLGFGVGEKTVGGRYTGDLAIKVYVQEKVSLSQLEESAIIPDEIQGYPTDIEIVGEVKALRFTRRYRPALGGSSISHPKVTAGTLGCLVVLNNNRLCILSNNHIVANSNDATIGDNCIQPGSKDGGVNPQDRIGVLESFVPIDFNGNPNTVDAATVWTNNRLSDPAHHSYVINPKPINPGLHMSVRKCGRTTQHTLGQITGTAVSIRVQFGGKIALFRDQVQIRGIGGLFSQGGDSGSLVVTAGTRQPVALLFAGGGEFTFANPIGPVISSIGINRFVSSPS